MTHASERPKIEDHWPGKSPKNNALLFYNLNSKQEVSFHHDIMFLLLFGNFSIWQVCWHSLHSRGDYHNIV